MYYGIDMPVKLKITALFTIISILVLTFVCGSTYYIARVNREGNITTRLKNRAITTARLLSQSETFNQDVIGKINALTASALRNKSVQAYGNDNRLIYSFADSKEDYINVDAETLLKARQEKTDYFHSGNQDAVAYHYKENANDIVIISAAYDELGESNLHQLLLTLITTCIGGVVISFISGYFFSTRLLAPVKHIADQTNEISAQNLAVRIPVGDTKDEWSYLANTLNRLLNRLQDSFESQRRFISNASHELSTPLTAMSSQLQVYLQKDRAAEEYKAVMMSVYQDVKHLSELTKTLLEFAKTSGNAGGIELADFRIDEVLLRIPAEISKINNDYHVALTFTELPEDDTALLVFGNEELLFTAIRNMVVNACKFSSDNRAIVTLGVNNAMITITIADNGPGIPESEVSRIFEPFYRSDTTNRTEGFGLGLSLSSRIIKLHKGNINVLSNAQGSIFKVQLPTGRF